jgi:aminoglycoside/choline kinase family phosphotransferase
MTKCFILTKFNRIKRVSFKTFRRWFRRTPEERRLVSYAIINGVEVATAFVGIDQREDENECKEPLIYATVISSGFYSNVEYYSSDEETAKYIHKYACEQVTECY